MDLGVEKARLHGVAVTALKNAGHLGRIGDWAERAAESDCASIHMVNVRGSLIVAPYGAVERRGSTSPFCAGVPHPGGEVLVPGEKERQTMAERRESGLSLSEGAWADILTAAEKVGMSDAEVEAALG